MKRKFIIVIRGTVTSESTPDVIDTLAVLPTRAQQVEEMERAVRDSVKLDLLHGVTVKDFDVAFLGRV